MYGVSDFEHNTIRQFKFLRFMLLFSIGYIEKQIEEVLMRKKISINKVKQIIFLKESINQQLEKQWNENYVSKLSQLKCTSNIFIWLQENLHWLKYKIYTRAKQ